MDRHLAPVREKMATSWQAECDAGSTLTIDRALSYAQEAG
jgi:hypothetical protein